MAKDFDTMEDSNRSANPTLRSLSRASRRQVLQLSMGAATSAIFGGLAAGCAAGGGAAGPKLGFKAIPATGADALVVPEGYVARVIAAWGEPVGIPGAMPAWRGDASHSAEEQALQMGQHHDGLQFYALEGSSRRGLLVMNHEYVDDGLLHRDGNRTWSAEKVRKAPNAIGVLAVMRRARREGRTMSQRPSLLSTSWYAVRSPTSDGSFTTSTFASDPSRLTICPTRPSTWMSVPVL